MHIWLIERPHLSESFFGGWPLAQWRAHLGERLSELCKILGGEPLVAMFARRRVSDLTEVNSSVPGHRKRQLRRLGRYTLYPHLDQRAGIEDGGQRGQPRLILVLRPKIAKRRIRQVRLH